MSQQTEEKIEGIDELPDPALFTQPEGEKRPQRRKKAQADSPDELNVNSLMDIMTILLVFLLKSYGSDPVQLKQAPDLLPPPSVSQVRPEQTAVITVTLKSVHVDHGDQPPMIELDEGANGMPKDPSQFQDGVYPTIVEQLNQYKDTKKKIQEMRGPIQETEEQKKKREGLERTVTIISDRKVSYKQLMMVMASATKAEFDKFNFLVIKG